MSSCFRLSVQCVWDGRAAGLSVMSWLSVSSPIVVCMQCLYLPFSFSACLPLSHIHSCASACVEATLQQVCCTKAHGFVYSHSRGVHPVYFTLDNERNVTGTIKCRYGAKGGIMESGMCFVRGFTLWFRGWCDSRLPQYCYLSSEWRCLNIQLETNGHESLTCRWRVRDPFSLTALWSCGMWEEVWHWADAPSEFSPWYMYLHTQSMCTDDVLSSFMCHGWQF